MATTEVAQRLLKRSCVTNLLIPRGLAITPCLSGPHGIGKSAICNRLAAALGGYCITVEGGSLKEGEITGIPYVKPSDDDSKEVAFAPYKATMSIINYEKQLFKQAQNGGFLNGTVKLEEDGSTTYVDSTGSHSIPAQDSALKTIRGEQNKFKFGEELPAEVKVKLLKSGEVKPIVLFIDEMNRTDNQTMKEMMNIVLTRSVNGYDFPWWVFVVSAVNPCGQDSVYSTNELDAAQLDRFLKIPVSADVEEWANYALDHGIDSDYIVAVGGVNDNAFSQSGAGFTDKCDDVTASPRSHEICSYIYHYADFVSNSGFFTSEEIMCQEEDVNMLFQGKIGPQAAREILTRLRNNKDYIEPAKLISGTSNKIDEKYVEKISSMRTISKNVLMQHILKFITTTMIKTKYDISSSNATTATAAKAKWANCIAQLKDLMQYLDPGTVVMFAKRAVNAKVNINDSKYEKHNGEGIIQSIITCFTSEILQQAALTTSFIDNGIGDKK